jgi:predicted amidophosphoribosyltransferase
MVFSSIGDTTRSSASPLQNEPRSGPLATQPLAWSALSSVRTLLQGLFATVFPADCRLCGVPLTNVSRLPVCEECLGAMAPISGPTCAACGEGLVRQNPWDTLPLCAVCQEDLPPYKKAVAFGAYDGELRELIHLLKYEQVHPAASVLGDLLEKAIAKLGLERPVLVVPVPLHGSKRRPRGFNQAELIARSALNRSQVKQFHLAAGLLLRVRPTASQIGLTRHQRQVFFRGAFRVTHLN